VDLLPKILDTPLCLSVFVLLVVYLLLMLEVLIYCRPSSLWIENAELHRSVVVFRVEDPVCVVCAPCVGVVKVLDSFDNRRVSNSNDAKLKLYRV